MLNTRFGLYAWFTHVKQTASKLDTHAQYSVFYKMADESEFAPPLLLFVLLGVWQQTSSEWEMGKRKVLFVLLHASRTSFGRLNNGEPKINNVTFCILFCAQ